MTFMFCGCNSLKSIDLSSFTFNQAIIKSIIFEFHFLTSIKFSKEYKLIDEAISMIMIYHILIHFQQLIWNICFMVVIH